VVADRGRTPPRAGRDPGVSWPIVRKTLADHAAHVLDGTSAATGATGLEETRRVQRPQHHPADPRRRLSRKHHGRHIRAAWQAEELLRDPPCPVCGHARTAPGRFAISAARHHFQHSFADRAHLHGPVTLAETVDQWWHGIQACVLVGIANAASESTNHLIKPDASHAFGSRNRENRRLRSRCATTRRSRREPAPG
jgi:hypothetical protein